MGTEVLRPQDCLIERIRVSPAVFNHQRRRNFYGNGNSNPPRVAGRRQVVRPENKKRFENNNNNNNNKPLISRRSVSLNDLGKNQNQLAMRQVTILRRGEFIAGGGDRRMEKKAVVDDMVVCETMGRLGPEPGMVRKQIQIGDLRVVSPATPPRDKSDVYAGFSYSMSPSPSSLPLPSFFGKKQSSKVVVVDDSATRGLRRLLRLD